MQIKQVAETPGGVPEEFGTRSIDSPVGEPTRRIFRKTFYLEFQTGGHAESLHVKPDLTSVLGKFTTMDYDARTVEGASISRYDSKGLIIELATPRNLLDISLAAGKMTGTGYKLDLYRLDPDKPTDEPFLTAHNGILYPVQYDGPAPTLIVGELHEGTQVIGAGGEYIAVLDMPVFQIGRVEQRFLMRIRDPDGDELTLSTSDIQQLRVRGYPTNPRIGLAFPDPSADDAEPSAEDVVFFWRAAGEIGRLTPGGGGGIGIGAETFLPSDFDTKKIEDGIHGGVQFDEFVSKATALQKAAFDETKRFGAELERLSTRYVAQRSDRPTTGEGPAVLPSSLIVALVFESDAPCRVEMQEIDVSYRLRRQSFPNGDPKRVLRFLAGRRSEQPVETLIPTNAVLRETILRLDTGLPADRAHHTGETGGDGEHPLGRSGAHVRGEVAAAQAFEPAEAVLATGLSVALMPMAAETEVDIELREDADGRPGRRLARATARPANPGTSEWVAVRFNEPVLLSTRKHWITLQSVAGSAIWISADDDSSTIEMLEPAPSEWRSVARLTGRRAMHALRTRAGISRGRAPLSARVGTATVAVEPAMTADAFTADLTTAAAAHLAEHSAPELMSVPVHIDAVGPGSVTVYPPEIEYEIP